MNKLFLEDYPPEYKQSKKLLEEEEEEYNPHEWSSSEEEEEEERAPLPRSFREREVPSKKEASLLSEETLEDSPVKKINISRDTTKRSLSSIETLSASPHEIGKPEKKKTKIIGGKGEVSPQRNIQMGPPETPVSNSNETSEESSPSSTVIAFFTPKKEGRLVKIEIINYKGVPISFRKSGQFKINPKRVDVNVLVTAHVPKSKFKEYYDPKTKKFTGYLSLNLHILERLDTKKPNSNAVSFYYVESRISFLFMAKQIDDESREFCVPKYKVPGFYQFEKGWTPNKAQDPYILPSTVIAEYQSPVRDVSALIFHYGGDTEITARLYVYISPNELTHIQAKAKEVRDVRIQRITSALSIEYRETAGRVWRLAADVKIPIYILANDANMTQEKYSRFCIPVGDFNSENRKAFGERVQNSKLYFFIEYHEVFRRLINEKIRDIPLGAFGFTGEDIILEGKKVPSFFAHELLPGETDKPFTITDINGISY